MTGWFTGAITAVRLAALHSAGLGSALLVALVLHGVPRPSVAAGLSVADNIALTRFSDPSLRERGALAKISPDGRHFVFVTTRGLLSSNQIESTLWSVESMDLDRYVNGDVSASAPAPKTVTTVTGTPRAQQSNSYGALITSVQWAGDSQSVSYLAESELGHRRIFRAYLDGRVVAVSEIVDDVASFGIGGDTYVYAAGTISDKPASVGVPINANAAFVTGLSTEEILFPDTPGVRDRVIPQQIVMTRRSETAFKWNSGRSSEPRTLLSGFSNLNPAVSPDGRFAVVATPVPEIPKSWEAYRTVNPAYLRFKARKRDESIFGAKVIWPTYYVLIDLDRKFVKPLIEAPGAVFGGYHDSEEIVWSTSGAAVLVGKTYLPIAGVGPSELAARSEACAVAAVRLASLESSCVAYSRSLDAHDPSWAASSAAFGVGDNEVVVTWRSSRTGDMQAERYRRRSDGWYSIGPVRGIQRAPKLEVSIKEDLNVPAALWVTDTKSKKSKLLWDPNPGLSTVDVGEASMYSWKDSSGYQWNGILVEPVNYHSGERYPLIIQTHGYSQHEFITDGAYTTAFAARPLSATGFMVLQIRERYDHIESDDEAPDQLRGYEGAIDSLSAEGKIDPKRVGIIGFSRTCYHVESALVHAPQRFAAAVIADGIDASYLQYLVFFETQTARSGESIYGAQPFGDGLVKWVNSAPDFLLYRVRTPLLIQAITPPGILLEREIYASLRLQHKPVELLYLPAGQHILQKPLERLASQQATVDWFRFWLQDYEDPDLVKVEQYKQWRNLTGAIAP